jgi:hypothetical protein
MDQGLERFRPPLLLFAVAAALGESGGNKAQQERGEQERRASHGKCFPRAMSANIAAPVGVAQASCRRRAHCGKYATHRENGQ